MTCDHNTVEAESAPAGISLVWSHVLGRGGLPLRPELPSVVHRTYEKLPRRLHLYLTIPTPLTLQPIILLLSATSLATMQCVPSLYVRRDSCTSARAKAWSPSLRLPLGSSEKPPTQPSPAVTRSLQLVRAHKRGHPATDQWLKLLQPGDYVKLIEEFKAEDLWGYAQDKIQLVSLRGNGFF